MRRAVLAIALLLAVTGPAALAWWDTQIMIVRDVPKVAEIEAENCSPTGAIVEDKVPFGPEPGGGKAVLLKPGEGTLTMKLKLARSIYVLFPIGRVAEADPVKSPTPEWPIFARMKVTGPDGKPVGDWSLQINYLNTYYPSSMPEIFTNVSSLVGALSQTDCGRRVLTPRSRGTRTSRPHVLRVRTIPAPRRFEAKLRWR